RHSGLVPDATVRRPARSALADRLAQRPLEPRAHLRRGLLDRRQRSARAARPRRRSGCGRPVKKRLLLIALLAVVIVSAAAAARLRRRSGPSLPTATVTKGTFIDYLQLRGEIRPIRSVTLTAPSSGSDLQIVELATNGAPVKAGDVVVQFDTTMQQRTLEQKQ